jgi:hypothetical protein
MFYTISNLNANGALVERIQQNHLEKPNQDEDWLGVLHTSHAQEQMSCEKHHNQKATMDFEGKEEEQE